MANADSVTDDEAALMVRLYEQQNSMSAIGRLLGRSPNTVTRWLRRKGVTLRSSGEQRHIDIATGVYTPRRTEFTDVEQEALERMYLTEKRDMRYCARKLGVSETVIKKYVYKHWPEEVRDSGLQQRINAERRRNGDDEAELATDKMCDLCGILIGEDGDDVHPNSPPWATRCWACRAQWGNAPAEVIEDMRLHKYEEWARLAEQA